jgi:hypothetical protein
MEAPVTTYVDRGYTVRLKRRIPSLSREELVPQTARSSGTFDDIHPALELHLSLECPLGGCVPSDMTPPDLWAQNPLRAYWFALAVM